MPTREELMVVITGQDNSRQAFTSLKNNASAAQQSVGQLAGALAGVGSGNVSGLLALPALFSGLAGTALALAGPLAALAAAFLVGGKVKETAEEFRNYARAQKEINEQTMLGLGPTQALTVFFQQRGIEADKAAQFMNKFAEQHVLAARGEGELYKEMLRVNSGLAEQFAATRTNTDGLKVFLAALMAADDGSARLFLKAAAGKGGGALLPALRELAGQGGIGAVAEQFKSLGLVIDDAVIDKQSKAAVAAELKARQVSNAWGQAAAAVYDKWRDIKKAIGLGPDNEISVAMRVKATVEGGENSLFARIAKLWARDDLTPRQKFLEMHGFRTGSPEERDARLQAGATPAGAISRMPLPSPRPPQGDIDAADLDAMQRALGLEKMRLSALGDLANASEILRVKESELTIAQRSGLKLAADEVELIKENNRVRQAGTLFALKSQLGVSNATAYLNQKTDELNVQLRDGKLSAEEYSVALEIAGRNAKEFGNQQEVLRSQFPDLTRLQQEFADTRKLADQSGAAMTNNLVGGLADILDGTKTASEGFAALGKTVVRTIDEMIIKMLIGRAVAQGLGSVMSSLGLGGPTVAGQNWLNAGQGIGPWAPIGHSGGVIGHLPGSRAVDPAIFAGARRYHSGGLLGGEVPLIGKRGEEIGWPDDLRRKYGSGGGAPAVTVNLIEDSSRAGQVSQPSSDGKGGLSIDVVVDSIMAKNMATPGTQTSKFMRNGLGIAPRMTKR